MRFTAGFAMNFIFYFTIFHSNTISQHLRHTSNHAHDQTIVKKKFPQHLRIHVWWLSTVLGAFAKKPGTKLII